MSINDLKVMKNLTILFISLFLITLSPLKSYADAWNNEKSRSTLTTSLYYSPTYKYGSTFQDEDVNNIYNERIVNKTTSKGISTSYEYGFNNDTSFIGDVDLGYITDSILVTAQTNARPTSSYLLATNYYDLNLDLGIKQNIYRDDFNVISVKGIFYPGNFIIKHHTTHLSKRVAGGLSLNYGTSFNIPFGLSTRPEYANYIDIGGEYKFYPTESHSEFQVDASIGVKPLDDRTIFVLGLYNTFNGYNYTKRPFNLNALNAGVDSLGVPGTANTSLKNAAYQAIRDKSSFSYHQLNFQIGYDLNKATTLYLQSFHNVFKGKSFKYNSYYLSLEYKY